MDAGNKTRLMFVHSTGPTHVHRRDEKTKRSMRRHVMREIGESRRIKKKNPSLNDLGPLMRPFWDQDPLAVIDQQWPMDVFAAYGLALLGTKCERPPGAGGDCCPFGSFYFPFAFSSSGFLRYFSPFYASPTLLHAAYHQSSTKARSMAMQRLVDTISCIEGAIANPNTDVAAGDNIILAVLGVICFNLVDLDYSQAHVHLNGMRSLIAARGGMNALQHHRDLVLMVFWVDVTISLLFNTKPHYPLPWSHMPVDIRAGLRTAPPTPISRLMNAQKDHNVLGLTLVSSCINELSLVAQDIESRLAERGDATWKDEMFLGLRVNPIVHRLLSCCAEDTNKALQQGRIVEMLRLGAILWVIGVKQRSRSYPGSPMMYLSDLCHLLRSQHYWAGDFTSESSDDILTVRLWLVAICGITSLSGTPQRTMAVRFTADTARSLGIEHWVDAKTQVRQMPWISIFDESYQEVWHQSHCLHDP